MPGGSQPGADRGFYMIKVNGPAVSGPDHYVRPGRPGRAGNVAARCSAPAEKSVETGPAGIKRNSAAAEALYSACYNAWGTMLHSA